MSSDAELHLLYKVANAPVSTFPYPHFYVRDVFPSDYYAKMQAMLPEPAALLPLPEVRNVPKDRYRERFVIMMAKDSLQVLPEEKRAFWDEMRSWIVGGDLGRVLLDKFSGLVSQRLSGQRVRFYDEAMLVQDTTNYALGPHSDRTQKVVTVLFYLPRDDSQSHLGTSIYLPKDRNFRCPGGPHYKREQFERLATMPFMPNSMFVFFKTDNSFHGVEPVTDPDTRRWLMLYDIYHQVEGQ